MAGRSPHPHVSRQLAAALGDSSTGAALLSRLAASRRIARILANDPELACCGFDFDQPGRCELRDRVLRLSAHSPAEIAKLRQSGPAIARTLANYGFEGIQIKLTVQPCHIDYRIRVSGEKIVGTVLDPPDEAPATPFNHMELRAFASKLAQTISNPLIRASAERMYRAIERKVAGMREEGNANELSRTDSNRS